LAHFYVSLSAPGGEAQTLGGFCMLAQPVQLSMHLFCFTWMTLARRNTKQNSKNKKHKQAGKISG
jgi:hypothetical protein